MTDLKEKLDAILKQYRERKGNGRPFTQVIFFADEDGDDVQHLLCYTEQLPAIMDFAKWYEPHMLVVRELGGVSYVYE